ncbi:MAG TPA: hypothetical protein PKM01_12500, partial [Anaerolineaceae bacterium]|nr:hypothetical protein [Anaerolineaceae bacterium]
MSKKIRLILPLMALMLAMLACGLPAIPTPPPGDIVETNVAATVGSIFADATPTPVATPTEPVPTITAAPSEMPTLPTPAERQVVFVQTGNLWLWRASSGAVQLTSDGGAAEARLSPDGQKVAYSKWMTEFNK